MRSFKRVMCKEFDTWLLCIVKIQMSARRKFQKLNRRLLLLIALTRYFFAYSKKFASFENVGWLFEGYLALFKTFLLYKLFWYLLHKSTSNQRSGKKIQNWISPRVAYSNFYSIQNLKSFYAKVNKIKTSNLNIVGFAVNGNLPPVFNLLGLVKQTLW